MEQLSNQILFTTLVVLIILSGFFSSSETSLIALNRYRLKHQVKMGHRGARLAKALLEKPDRLIGLILFGNNLVNVLASFIVTILTLRLLGDSSLGFWVSAVGFTFVLLIFAELAPKTVAVEYPERIAFPAAFILTPLLKLFYPIVVVINFTANNLLRLFGIKAKPGRMEQLTRDELRTLVSDDHRDLSGNHQQMLLNILDLEHGRIEDVMVPRQEVIGIDLNEDWNTLLPKLSQSLYTRLPVFKGDLDNLVGLLHIRTILARLSQGRLSFGDLQRSVRNPYFIPEGTSLTQQLLEFQRLERRMGMVVDEYGDIQGLVTLDDILEEIVGDYTTDARAVGNKQARRMDDGAWLVDGGASLRMLNRQFDWALPTDGATTLNGLLLEILELIPDGKVALRIGELIFTVAEIGDNSIRKVLVKTYQKKMLED